MKSIRTAGAVVLAIALAGGLTACQPPAPPPLPEVVWEVPPSSPLEEDPYVQAVRAADLTLLHADNHSNYAFAEFLGTHTESAADGLARNRVLELKLDRAPKVWVGPTIWQPVEVVPTEDGADVLMCWASRDWYRSADHEPFTELEKGGGITRVTIVESEGALKVRTMAPIGEDCDASEAPVGRFDPAPVLPESWGEVVMPPEARR